MIITEHFDPNCDGFGFLLEVDDVNPYPDTSWSITVREVIGDNTDEDHPVIDRDRCSEPYLTAYVKWDGCFQFTYEDGAIHFCGVRDLLLHIALIKRLHTRAYELMCREPLDGEEWPELWEWPE